jgi:hypothetical protein
MINKLLRRKDGKMSPPKNQMALSNTSATIATWLRAKTKKESVRLQLSAWGTSAGDGLGKST